MRYLSRRTCKCGSFCSASLFSPHVVSRNLTSLLISLIMKVLMLNTKIVSLLDSVGGYFCVHLNFLLFLHRLAEEARTNAFENKSKIIKSEHTVAAAKVILKKSRG
nr:PREDICTED: centromere protein W isoform X1 [Haliaeetus albicilla]